MRSTKQLSRPPFRRDLYRALLLILYCTGVRFGEAVRLCLNDLDMRRCRFYIVESKGRSRWVPFHRSLKREFERYLIARRRFAPGVSEKRLFLSAGRRALSLNSASETIRGLLRDAGLKPPSGRSGPRPYDFRHTFAVHRLTRWYRSGVDLQSHLPLLSAYMGHNDILGTETYLTATPELLSLAAQRLHRRLRGARRPS